MGCRSSGGSAEPAIAAAIFGRTDVFPAALLSQLLQATDGLPAQQSSQVSSQCPTGKCKVRTTKALDFLFRLSCQVRVLRIKIEGPALKPVCTQPTNTIGIFPFCKQLTAQLSCQHRRFKRFS